MNIYLAHIHFTVKVRPFKKPPKHLPFADAWFSADHIDNCTIYLKKNSPPNVIAHELVHVLQHICACRGIEFTEESGHMGYIMQHLMGRILKRD